jgi:hypothetical protein
VELLADYEVRKTGQPKQTVPKRAPVPAAPPDDRLPGSTYDRGDGRSIRHVGACGAEGDLVGFGANDGNRTPHGTNVCKRGVMWGKLYRLDGYRFACSRVCDPCSRVYRIYKALFGKAAHDWQGLLAPRTDLSAQLWRPDAKRCKWVRMWGNVRQDQ